MTINKTEKFKLRKSKKYKNLVSVGLGVMTAVAIGVASDNEAYASDQTIGNATNSTTTQPPANKVQSDNLANTNTSTGAVNINIDNSNVRNAVNKAKSEGVNVVEKTQDLGVTTSTEETTRKRNEAIEQNKAEENKINEVVNNYKKEKEANQNAINTATSENREKQAQYEKDLANYNKEKAEIEKFNNNAKVENKRKTDEYNNRVADINRENESIRTENSKKERRYQNELAEYNNQVAKIERVKQEVKTTKPLLAQSGGIAVYGDYNLAGAGSTDFYKDLTILEDNKITNTTALVDGIQWRNNTEVEKISGNFSNEKNASELYSLRHIKTGDKFKIKNVGTTVDGRNVNLNVTAVIGNPMGQSVAGEPVSEQNLRITREQSNSIYFDYSNMENISLVFNLVDDNDNKLRFGLGTLVSDVDWSQGSKLQFSDSSKSITPPGSELKEKNGTFFSNNESYSNFNSTPKGTYLTIGYGDSLTYTHYTKETLLLSDNDRIKNDQIIEENNKNNKDNIKEYAVAFNLFGKSAELKKIPNPRPVPKPKLDSEKSLPERPRLETLKEEPPKPEQPTLKPIPREITAPTVGYTSFRLAERPRVFKEARNLDNISLDNSLVSKNSTVKFTLKVDKLPAGREALSVLEFTDHLPQGYVIDEATVTRENNALGYNTAYDKANHTVVFSANSTLLNKLNANLNEVVDMVAPTVTGTVTNDGGIYKNNFKINLNNKYTTHSNVVTVNTPNGITPNKVNTNADNSNIDGKIVVAETTNYYKLLWDLDQYKGMKLSRNDIAKGFYYLEDYPEEAVTINNRLVSLVDSNGQAVTGVEVNSYDSLENAPENVKTMLSKANITPKGAFQLFTATNPTDFYNKYVVTGNSIKITNPMVVKDRLTQTGGVYENKAYQIDLGNGYATETVRNIVPKVDTNKHNYNEDGVLIDGKQVVAGTTNHYKLLWDLDQYRGMNATNSEIARGFFFVEDYPEEALTIDNSKVTMLDSKGQTVTGVEVSSYNSLENAPEDIKKLLGDIKLAPKGAFQLFKARNAKDFFNKYVLTGNSITITTPMKVKEELTTTGGTYNNKAYQVDFGKTFETNIVTNIVPKVTPEKHNTNEDGVVVDGKVIAPETVNNYKLLWDLDQYKGVVATSRELAKGFYFVEDYPEEALAINNSKVTMVDSKGQAVTGVEVLSYDSVENAPDDIKKALVNAKITPKGAFQVYRATNSREFYDKYVFTGNSITITSPMTMLDSVNKNGSVYNNKAYQIDFGKGRETDVVTNTVPKSNPEKHNYNEDGVLIDGGVVPVGSITEYKLTWKLSNLRDVVGTNEAINRGFYYIDDYPEVLKTLDDRIKVLDSNGNVVNGIRVTKYDNLEQASNEIKAILSKNNITPKGAFQVFSAENPIEFYNNYVKKGIDLTIVNPMQVTQTLKENGGSYQNVAYEIDFGVAQVTDTITNTVPKVKTVKHNYNEDNVKIDGKVVLAASRTNYKLNWNLSAYKNIEASDKYIKKGFYFVDDYPEEALSLDEKNITITDDKGKAVAGVEVVNYESLEKAPEEVKAVLKEAKVTPRGAFQLFRATDPKQFYNDYVKTGTNLTITNPMTVKPELARKDKVTKGTGKTIEYKNRGYQIDFGNGYETDVVANNVPKIDPIKDVVIDIKGKESLQGKEIELNKLFNYKLIGTEIPSNRGTKLTQYGFSDDYDEKADKYQANYRVFSMKDIKLTDGSIIKQDSELTKYTTQIMTDGKVDIEFDKEFLDKIDLDSEFQAEVYLQMERIASGEVKNTFIHTVNGVEETSNTVTTFTKEPEKPVEPVKPEKPEEPKQSVPPKVEEKTPNKSTGKVLPNTGVADNDGTSTAIALTALATAGFIARRKKVKNS